MQHNEPNYAEMLETILDKSNFISPQYAQHLLGTQHASSVVKSCDEKIWKTRAHTFDHNEVIFGERSHFLEFFEVELFNPVDDLRKSGEGALLVNILLAI